MYWEAGEHKTMALQHHPSMTVEEYLQLDKQSTEAKYEYIDGHVRMLAGGTPNHAKVSANIIVALGSLLAHSPCSVYTSDVRVRLSVARFVYPDITISCDGRDQTQEETIQYPKIVIEVLSPSTERYDKGKKFTYYQQCPSIQEYVLVDMQRQWIEVFKRERNNFWLYRAFGAEDTVELASLDIQFSVASVYRNVILLPEEDN